MSNIGDYNATIKNISLISLFKDPYLHNTDRLWLWLSNKSIIIQVLFKNSPRLNK